MRRALIALLESIFADSVTNGLESLIALKRPIGRKMTARTKRIRLMRQKPNLFCRPEALTRATPDASN